jgi:hypothetical protein
MPRPKGGTFIDAFRLDGGIFDIDEKTPLTARDFLQWKERRFFGDRSRLAPADDDSGKLRVLAEMAAPSSWLDFVMAHELGHVVELAFDLQHSWRQLPWKHNPAQWPKRFPKNLEMIAGGVFKPEEAGLLYSALETGSTASLYGSSSVQEDFAESFALYVLHRDRAFSLRVEPPGLPGVDLVAHLSSEAMEPKKTMLENIVKDLEILFDERRKQ